MSNIRLSEDIQDFLNRKTTTDFLEAARGFIQLLETNGIPNDVFYRTAHLSLSQLYATGHKLEEIDLKYSSADSDFDEDKLFDGKDVKQIFTLGEDAFYSEVFDPIYDKKEEVVQGWLVDDFLDIYRDLKIELRKIDTICTDEAVEDALWQLKWSFLNHWGQHCINALRALHYLVYDGKHVM
jgi:hypothetical protein